MKSSAAQHHAGAQQRLGQAGIVIGEDDLEPLPFGPARLSSNAISSSPKRVRIVRDSAWPGCASIIAAAPSIAKACARGLSSSSAIDAVSSNSAEAQSRCFCARASRAVTPSAQSARPFESSEPTSSHQVRSKFMKLRKRR
jgi:hypothetical protein